MPHGSCDQFNISALQVLQGISSLCLIRRLFIAKRSLYKMPSLYKNSDVHAYFIYSFYAVFNVPTHAHWFLKQKIILLLSLNIWITKIICVSSDDGKHSRLYDRPKLTKCKHISEMCLHFCVLSLGLHFEIPFIFNRITLVYELCY